MTNKVLAVAMAAALSLPAVALAADSTKRIDKRQENQEKRIDQGVESGKLTDKEAKNLEKGQEHVQKLEDKALADGKVTKLEKAKIEHAQNKQSRKIVRKKHNAKTTETAK